jgi:hypothetical protein
MSAGAVRQGTRECLYCAGPFVGRSDAVYCCTACRVAGAAALRETDPDPVSLRRETRSAERAAARLDRIGLVTRREAYEGALRVRARHRIDPCDWCRYRVRRAGVR